MLPIFEMFVKLFTLIYCVSSITCNLVVMWPCFIFIFLVTQIPSPVNRLFGSFVHFFSFFLFWLCPWHMEVPGPGIESEPQLWPTPPVAMIDPLIHCPGMRIEPMPPQRQPWILNPMCHSGNCSFVHFFYCILCLNIFTGILMLSILSFCQPDAL